MYILINNMIITTLPITENDYFLVTNLNNNLVTIKKLNV